MLEIFLISIRHEKELLQMFYVIICIYAFNIFFPYGFFPTESVCFFKLKAIEISHFEFFVNAIFKRIKIINNMHISEHFYSKFVKYRCIYLYIFTTFLVFL